MKEELLKITKDMTTEEKAVIDEFEGEESYNEMLSKKDYYLSETSNILMLEG